MLHGNSMDSLDCDVMLNQQIKYVEKCCTQSLRVEEKLKTADTALEIQTKLKKLKLQFTQLKNIWRDQRSKLYMLRNLDRDGNKLDQLDIESDLKNSTEAVQETKEELDNCRIRFEDFAVTAEKYHTEYHELLALLADKIAKLQAKRQRVEGKKSELERKLQLLSDTKRTESIANIKHELSEMTSNLVQPEQMLVRLQEECRESKEQCAAMMAKTSADEHSVDSQLALCEGIQVTQITTTSYVIDISCDVDTVICVNVQFARTKQGKYMLASAQLQTEFCEPDLLYDLENALSLAVDSRNICLLITSVREVYTHRSVFMKEIENLQKSFALDWSPSDHQINVMFGQETDVLVTLQLSPLSYLHGNVTLVQVDGLRDDRDLNSLVPEDKKQTVTGWFEALKELLKDH